MKSIYNISIVNTIAAFVLLAAWAGCSKPGFSPDLQGTNTIRGVLLLHDTLTGPYSYRALAGQIVYIANPADSSSYLYSTKTDNLGQFSFAGFDSTAKYRIYASYDSNQIHYTGNLMYASYSAGFLHGRDSLLLGPDTLGQNGIVYFLVDNKGGRIPNARVYLFTSTLLYNMNDSLGSNYQLTADLYGRCSKFNIQPGDYYAHAFFKADTTAGSVVIWKGADNKAVTVRNNGISLRTDTLR